MNSMTGYGSSLLKNRHLELEVHVKSVNGRFLETRFHLPKEYAPFENDLRQIFQSGKWSRGTVDVYIQRRPTADSRLEMAKLRPQAAKHWNKCLRQLVRDLNLQAEVGLRDILQMPGVLEHQERTTLIAGEIKWVQKQVRRAVDNCQEFRSREGLVLKKELLIQLKNLENCLQSMQSWREEAIKSSEMRLKSRLATLAAEQLDASRLALETALLIDKMDVREEMVRLSEHIKACRQLIGSPEAKGKSLDFFCQELLREVNTIGSKSQLASLTQVVVEAKSVIEKFREQVQNIE